MRFYPHPSSALLQRDFIWFGTVLLQMKMAASKCSKQNGALNLQKLSPAVYLLLLLALHFPQTTSPDRTIMFPVPLIIICLELITLLLLISSLLPSPFSLLLPKLANMLPWCSKPFWACFTHVYIKIFYIKLSTDLLAKFHNIFFSASYIMCPWHCWTRLSFGKPRLQDTASFPCLTLSFTLPLQLQFFYSLCSVPKLKHLPFLHLSGPVWAVSFLPKWFIKTSLLWFLPSKLE